MDEYEFFGMRQFADDVRNDYARAVSANGCWVLVIHKESYEQIVKRTQLSAAEQKIDFLIRYVPKLRSVTRSMIEELEVFFIKEVVTQGYILQRQDEQDDYIYFVYKGKCRLLLNTSSTTDLIPQELEKHFSMNGRKQLVIGNLKRGDSFGEHSALNDLPNPFTVEAYTKEVHLYKILRGHFI